MTALLARRIRSLREKHINRRKQHVLKFSNIYKICMSFSVNLYWYQRIRQLTMSQWCAKSTTQKLLSTNLIQLIHMSVLIETVHRQLMSICALVQIMQSQLSLSFINYHHFIGYPNYTNSLVVQDLLQPLISVVQSRCRNCLPHVCTRSPVTLNNIVMLYTRGQV